MTRSSVLLATLLLVGCVFKFDRELGPGQIKATLVATGASGEVPAVNARVAIENSLLHVNTDSKGVFVLRGLVAGDYTLRITYDSQHNGTIDSGLRLKVHLDSGGGNGLANSRDLGKVSLVALGDIAGTVVNGATPVSGATVVLDTFSQTRTDTTGFGFHNLLSGDYDVSLVATTGTGSSATTQIQAHVPVHVDPKNTTRMAPFDLGQIQPVSQMGSLQGMAKLAGTGSNEGIQVTVSLPEVANLETSDAVGDYLLTSAPPGIYTVTASQGGFLTVSVPFVVIGEDTTLVPPILLPAQTPDCGLGLEGTTSSGGGLGDACTCSASGTSDPFDPCNLNENKPCDTDADCIAGQFCDQEASPKACWSCSLNQPSNCGPVAGGGPGCNVCSGSTPLCVAGACVGCTSDIDCSAGQYCGSETQGGVKTCLSCSLTDAQHCGTASTAVGCNVCSGLTPACVDGACSHCTADANCPSGQYCFMGQTTSVCTACTDTDSQHCGPSCAVCSGGTPVCAAGSCVACAADADCTSGNFCDLGTHTCARSWTLVDDQPVPQVSPSLVYDSNHHRLVAFGGSGQGFANAVFTWSLDAATKAWTLVPTTGVPNDAGLWGAAAYDPIGDQILRVGSNGIETIQIKADGTGTWGALVAQGGPTGRDGVTVTYDSAGKRLIAFGGYDATFGTLNDVWALPLDGSAAVWRQLMEADMTGAGPAGRRVASLAFDPATSTLYVSGGESWNGQGYQAAGDTWALHLPAQAAPTWELVSNDNQVSLFRYNALAFDSDNQQLISFGGDNDGSIEASFWTLPLSGTFPATWTSTSLSGSPSARIYAGSVYVPAGTQTGQFWLFGGSDDGYRPLNDLWRLSFPAQGTPTWTQLEMSFSMPDDGAAVYDAAHDRLVVFDASGDNGSTTIFTKSYSSAGPWTAFGDGESGPMYRTGSIAAYDSDQHRMIIFGGLTEGYYQDTWALNLDDSPLTWEEISSGDSDQNVPSFMNQPVGVYDSQNKQLVVYNSSLDTVATLPLNMSNPTWQRPTVDGQGPGALAVRSNMTGVYDSVGHRLIVFGGTDWQSTNYNETWALSLPATGNPSWTQLTFAGQQPSARYGTNAIFDTPNNRMLLYGGTTGRPPVHPFSSDVWELSLAGTPQWTELCPASSQTSPGSRDGFLMLGAPDGVVFLGGAIINSSTGDRSADNGVYRLNYSEPVCPSGT